MKIENELQSALQRQAAPTSLRGSVMKQIRGRETKRWRMQWMRMAAAAAFVVLLGSATTTVVVEQRERSRARHAKEELMTAMKITAEKSTIARRAVNQH